MQIYTGCTPESITSSMLLLRLNATLIKADSAWAPATRKHICLHASIGFHVSICFRFRQPNRRMLKRGSKILIGLATVCHLVREKEGRLHLFMWVCKLLKWNICSEVMGAFGALDLYPSPPPLMSCQGFIFTCWWKMMQMAAQVCLQWWITASKSKGEFISTCF